MTRLTWLDPSNRFFETGLDRGVLYPKSAKGLSVSSLVIGTGSKTFVLSPNMYEPFRIGSLVKAVDSTGAKYMIGTVTASSMSSITLNVTSTAGAGTVASWTLTQLDLAVVWDGLTSIDEDGADGAASYYIDGRPFLFLPKPKEFTATLKAYIYPDEFSKIMGEVEATDGMYLDSQQMSSFDLCYRTRIGNAIDGADYGYKIHLIYNATVVPQGKSYQTMGDQINPLEFSWQIQAVPVQVAGYRPTAHVIIDTRHMDPSKLAAIEDMLYGTSTTPAGMPDAQVVFDTLSFGDTIVITDNGDGTWEAQGSYHNIYLIGDGIFEIDNVNAVDHGDGTYDISSTP